MKPSEIIARVRGGATLTVDFPGRTFTLDGKRRPAADLEREPSPDGPLETLETLYSQYKHSVPSERSDRRKKNYFKALPVDELDDDDLLFGKGREEARAELELHALACIADGSITWEDIARPGQWFRRSPRDADLVLLREWFENQSETNQTKK